MVIQAEDDDRLSRGQDTGRVHALLHLAGHVAHLSRKTLSDPCPIAPRVRQGICRRDPYQVKPQVVGLAFNLLSEDGSIFHNE